MQVKTLPSRWLWTEVIWPSVTLSSLQYVLPSWGLSHAVIYAQNQQAFILSGWSLDEFQRSGAWCPSTTPGFTKADARIAFGQSAPNVWAFDHTHVRWDVRLNPWSTAYCQFTNVRGWIQNYFIICWSSFTIMLDLQDKACGCTVLIRVDHRNETKCKIKKATKNERKEWGRNKREKSSNSCLSSALVTPWWTKGSPPGGRPIQKEPAMWPRTKEGVGPPTVTRIKEDNSLRW